MSHSTLNNFFGCVLCWRYLIKTSFDHFKANLLDIVLFKKYTHKQFGWGSIWLRLSLGEAESEMPHAIKDTSKTCCQTLCSVSQWKEVPAAQVSCGPAFTHTELKPTWLSTSSNHGGGGGIRQVWVGGSSTNYGGASAKYGGASAKYGGGHQSNMGGSSTNYGGAISQVWGGHQPSMGRGVINQLWGGPSANYGGAISQLWGGHIFPPVCTGSQNPQNYFSNTYVLPSVNRTAGPKKSVKPTITLFHSFLFGFCFSLQDVCFTG